MPEFIDRDTAIQMIRRKPDFTEDEKIALIGRMQIIKAADVKPVVHGEWIEDRTEYVCSACGQRVDGEIVFMIKPNSLPGFCPNPKCGAQMF